MAVPDDFTKLLPGVGLDYNSPDDFLWIFNPQSGEVTVEHNDDRHPAREIMHAELSERVGHPEPVCGHAYRIHMGWRITDDAHRPVTDPYIINQVLKQLHRLR